MATHFYKHASTIDADYRELTPSEMADQADADNRRARIGGPALLATFDGQGTLERVAPGEFADRVLGHIKAIEPAAVVRFAAQNRAAFQEFWAFNKTDALALKAEIEKRSMVPA